MDGNDPFDAEGGKDARVKDGPAGGGERDNAAHGDAPLDWQSIRQIYGVDQAALIDWEGVKRAVIESDLSLDRIGEAFGVSGATISKHAKQGGWVRKLGTKRLRPGRQPRPLGVPRRKPRPVAEIRRRKLRARLFLV